MSDFFRIYVEKKAGHNSDSTALTEDLKITLGTIGLKQARIVNIYEVTGLDKGAFQKVTTSIFSEATADKVYKSAPTEGVADFFGFEFLPGQFDQRADSAAQCIHLLYPDWNGVVRSSKLILLEGTISTEELKKIKAYCINPVESREKDMDSHSLFDLGTESADVPVLEGFNKASDAELELLKQDMGLAMTFEDLKFCQTYFRKEEQRDPVETELKVLDTYWSDHCRHTTFETELKDITIPLGSFQQTLTQSFNHYLEVRKKLGRSEKPLTLMDLATISGRRMHHDGLLDDLEISEEINACSVRITVDVDGREEPWLLMFKNETHNHPTEIEPFGGASTCIGGAIRDPLSGRSYVYQAMRITGSGDPTASLEETLEGKLPQKYITRTAAHGYSSYGNQIGLATTFVKEIYHPGYQAKRMEVGAVVGAVPESMVRRESPVEGDAIILIGGKTGRDGCGGATGSSKEHTTESLISCSAEVQKGNAPEERKIQRLFRNPEVTSLIKKCNDFGAGGVSVAIGELSDGLEIDLDKIPVKYMGLSGTELAISESQERMAVVTSHGDASRIIQLAAEENLDATHVATVTAKKRLTMTWKGSTIVDLSRKFLDTNGVRSENSVTLPEVDSSVNPFEREVSGKDEKERFLNNLKGLNICSQRGLVEMFDASIGAGTVQMPFGGKNQLSEAEASIHKLPVESGKTETCSIMAYGFDPELFDWSPYHGSLYSVVSSVVKLAASGGAWRTARLSFQEYFRRLGEDPRNWGLPFSALLGAMEAQEKLNIPAIGGKDSMSGSFHDIHVPPTLISFAVTTGKIQKTISSDLKEIDSSLYFMNLPLREDLTPDWKVLSENMDQFENWNTAGKILSASTIKSGGIGECLFKMASGNGLGIHIDEPDISLYNKSPGGILFESMDSELEKSNTHLEKIGRTQIAPVIDSDVFSVTLDECLENWEKTLNTVFPDYDDNPSEELSLKTVKATPSKNKTPGQKPLVFIPVFPGTNCEYDTARAFDQAGADTEISVFTNRDKQDVLTSLRSMVKHINRSQILMLSGGFSAGDEPEGSGKFIANVLKNPEVAAAIEKLLERDGLILGICNGFQALVKSGLLPYGHVIDVPPEAPTLARNSINRHVSRMVTTKVINNTSPWTAQMTPGDLHEIAISHGEGRFTAVDSFIRDLEERGQIAFQYCDSRGTASMNPRYNPNGSDFAIEGITSPCGRILGKMGHTERYTGDNLRNIPGNKLQPLFKSGVEYFI